jgi:hypothetical protein
MRTIGPGLVLTMLLAAAAAEAQEAAGGAYRLHREAVSAERTPLAGAGFVLSAEVVPPTSPRGGGFLLTSGRASCAGGAASQAGGGCGCLCLDTIFADGFESGNTSAWSSSTP